MATITAGFRALDEYLSTQEALQNGDADKFINNISKELGQRYGKRMTIRKVNILEVRNGFDFDVMTLRVWVYKTAIYVTVLTDPITYDIYKIRICKGRE